MLKKGYPMTGLDLFDPVSTELNMVETGLLTSIDTDLPVLEQAASHLIKAGGKRLRPAFVLLAAKFFGDEVKHAIPLAISLELIHMASLVHDDVIDDSELRRGKPTVKSQWGNRLSIYTGNYVLAKSLALAADYQRRDVIEVMANTSMSICEGEIRQMRSCFDVGQGLKDYLRRIERKTALLIAVSCQLGAMVSMASPEHVQALKRFGYYLGMAFQITDDILDFVADESILGKPVGSDIRQGVITLPAIYAIRCSPQGKRLAELLSSPESCSERAEEIIGLITDSDGIDYAYYASNRFTEMALRQLDRLPDVRVKESFRRITEFISGREY